MSVYFTAQVWVICTVIMDRMRPSAWICEFVCMCKCITVPLIRICAFLHTVHIHIFDVCTSEWFEAIAIYIWREKNNVFRSVCTKWSPRLLRWIYLRLSSFFFSLKKCGWITISGSILNSTKINSMVMFAVSTRWFQTNIADFKRNVQLP